VDELPEEGFIPRLVDSYWVKSLSDHRHILFTLRGSVPVLLVRNPRGTNWGSFRRDLREKLERGPEMNIEDEAKLGLAVHWIQ
jgi:hypothetical protein